MTDNYYILKQPPQRLRQHYILRCALELIGMVYDKLGMATVELCVIRNTHDRKRARDGVCAFHDHTDLNEDLIGAIDRVTREDPLFNDEVSEHLAIGNEDHSPILEEVLTTFYEILEGTIR